MNRGYTIFIDFDGTITSGDVGYEMFKKFTGGKTESTVQLYRRGMIDSRQCLSIECKIWNQSPPNPEKVYEYLNGQKIAPGLIEFLDLLNHYGIEAIILSEGFDFYIDSILRSHGITRLKKITNKAVYEDEMIKPEFPYFDLGCGRCSNCKGYHISNIRHPGSSAIFIGDGHSDHHGAWAADIVFAKSFLKNHLDDINRPYFDYVDFLDIAEKWKMIWARRIFSASKRIVFCWVSERHHGNLQTLWESGEVMKNVGYPEGLQWSQNRYNEFLKKRESKNDRIFLALEDDSGKFLGEATISSPDREDLCKHDLKLVPEIQGRGFGREGWNFILERSSNRWPDSLALVTPSVENTRAINLYISLGFEFDGGEMEWTPPSDNKAAIPLRYRRMIRKQRNFRYSAE